MIFVQQTYALDGFTGNPTPGRRAGTEAVSGADVPTSDVVEQSNVPTLDGGEETGLDGSDEAEAQITAVVEYLATLSV